MQSERKPCLCIFSASYLPNIGGVETYTANLAEALIELGYRVIVVTSNTHSLSSKETVRDIEIVRLPCWPLLGGRYPVPKKNTEHKRLLSWLDRQPVDYVIVNTRFYLHSRLGLSFSCGKGIAPVLIEHGSAHLTMGSPLVDKGVELVEHLLTAQNKRYGASYYAVSAKGSAWLKHFGLASQGELYNSIDADTYLSESSNRAFRAEYEIPDGNLVVAFIGRLVPEKGVQAIAEASRLLDGRSDVTFLVAGDGPLRADLAPQESASFRLVGRLGPADVAALLFQADALCLPSRSEGFATTLLEAAACHTPSIVTDVGGVNELVPSDEYGIAISDAKPETISCAIAWAADHRKELAEKGRRVGELVRKEFSWVKTAEKAVEACRKAQRNSEEE